MIFVNEFFTETSVLKICLIFWIWDKIVFVFNTESFANILGCVFRVVITFYFLDKINLTTRSAAREAIKGIIYLALHVTGAGAFPPALKAKEEKELLELYKISYGALYRWKRKGLIPEDWFIKKSTVTGQETFFPRQLICERMELIQKQKDETSLEELSKHFSSESKKNATIILDTAFGRKTFYLSDIKAIIVDNGEGAQRDITNEIFGGKQ